MTVKVKCLLCGVIVESKHVNDAISCGCGRICVSGGDEYFRLTTGRDAKYDILDDGVKRDPSVCSSCGGRVIGPVCERCWALNK